MSRYRNSIEHTVFARQATPGGAQTMSKQVSRFVEGAYPAYVNGGDGARVRDIDGNWYVDWICALGAVPLGHQHPEVDAAITSQLRKGINFSLPSTLEAQVASRLVAVIPCAEQIRFVKTGSEACSGAARIARRVTGRDTIIVVGYHGWHDWVQVTSEAHPGVPESYGLTVKRVAYNDWDGLSNILTAPVAAVMMEPTLLDPPKEGYLENIRAACFDVGALLIFDEMVMGGRWRLAGGSDYFDVEPDLAVYGKAFGNGMPMAFIAGRERYMWAADVISGTFGGECLSLAACRSVLDIYERENIIERQWQRGMDFCELCYDYGIPHKGYAVHPKITYEGDDMARFLQATAREGILIHPGGCNVSAVLTDEDMEVTRKALKAGAEAVRDQVPLRGIPPQDSILKRLS